MKRSKKRFLASFSIVTLLAPMLLNSVEIFAEDYATSTPTETTQTMDPSFSEDFSVESTESSLPSETSELSTEETFSTTDESFFPEDSSFPEDDVVVDSSTEIPDFSDSSLEEESSSDVENDTPDHDWTGGIGLDDLEIDQTIDERFTLSPANIIKHSTNPDYVLQTKDGLLSLKLTTNYYFSSYTGYDSKNDILNVFAAGVISLTDSNSGDLYSFSDSQGEINVYDFGDETEQTFYFKDKKGKVTEYNLTLAIEELSISTEKEVKMAKETSGKVIKTEDGLVKLTLDYESFSWNIQTTTNDWQVLNDDLNDDTESYILDKRYEELSYHIAIYSEKLQQVKAYSFKVDRVISESDVIDHEINITLSKNNQFSFANEFYQTYDDLLPGLSILGYYRYSDFYLEINKDYEEDYYRDNQLRYGETDGNRDYVSYLEKISTEYVLDENGDYVDTIEKKMRIKLNIHLDNTTEIDESLEKPFTFTLEHEDLVLNSKEDQPYEIDLSYGGPSDLTETFRIGYLNTNDFDDGKDVVYKGDYVEVYESSDSVSSLNEVEPGKFIGYSNYGIPLHFNILNGPQAHSETVSVPIGRKTNWEKPTEVSPQSDENFRISGYRDGLSYYLSFDYDYDGLHYYESAQDWIYNTPLDSKVVDQKIYKRKHATGKIVAIYTVQFQFDTIDYQLQAPLEITIPKKLGFNRVYLETPDGEAVLVGSSDEYDEENFSYHVYAFPTKQGEKNKTLLYYNGYHWPNDSESETTEDNFLYTETQNGIFKKYPVTVIPEVNGENPTIREYYEFDIKATSQELLQVKPNSEYFTHGKPFDLAYSDYESTYVSIYLDRENAFRAHDKSTPADERFILFYQGALPFKKVSHNRYQLIDEYLSFVYNLTITDGAVSDILPTKLELSKEKVTIAAGSTATISATITPKDATNQSLTWTSKDEKIATVKNGVISGLKEGKTTITAETVNGLKQSIAVTVEKEAEVPIIKEEIKDESGSGISVSAPEGVLPKGAELKVEPIKPTNDVHQQLDKLTEGKFVLFDIKLENSGQHVQPNGMVAVRVPIPTGFDPAKIKMYHFDEVTGKRTALKGWVEGAYYVFETDHFSYYSLVEEEPEEEKEDNADLPEVNKQSLEALILKAEALKQGDYTAETWLLFTEKLRAAQGTAANKLATEAEVKIALDALAAAIAGLVKESGETDIKEPEDDTTDTEGTDASTDRKPVVEESVMQDSTENDTIVNGETNPSTSEQDSPIVENVKNETEKPKPSEHVLPQLGEGTTLTLTITGVLLIVLASLLYYRRRDS